MLTISREDLFAASQEYEHIELAL